jgi:hypothetical protein
MPDKPEAPSQAMNRLIRETPARRNRQQMADAIRRNWTRPTSKETDRD